MDDDPVHEEPNPTQQVKITGAVLAAEASRIEAGLQQGHDQDGWSEPGKIDLHEDSPGNDEPPEGAGEDDLKLPSWTDPPTGVVPAVLREIARESGDSEEEVAMLEEGALHAPSWREHAHEWEALDVDVEVLFGDKEEDGSIVAERSTGASAESSGQESAGAAYASMRESRESGEGQEDEGSPVAGRARGTKRMRGAKGARGAGRAKGTEGARVISENTVENEMVVVHEEASGALREDIKEDDTARVSGRRDIYHRFAGSVRKDSGRNLAVAIASGLAIGGLALLSFYLGPLPAVIFCSAVVLLASMECYATLRRAHRHPITLIGLLGSLAAMIASYNAGLAGLAVTASAVFGVAAIWLVLMPRARVRTITRASSTIFGFLWIGMLGSYSALLLNPATFPHRHGIAFLLGAIIATVATDVGAYAAGSLYGRHKMAPVISPNKSWEGYAGAVVASVGVSAGILPMISPWTFSSAILLGVVVAVVSPLGDLVESMIKRELGVKDMGFILPGHGGILDRIDGLLFALPATFFLVSIIRF